MGAFYEWLYRWSKRKRYPYMVGENNMRLSANGFKVSQHALIRYFERVEKYDIQNILDGLTRSLKHKDGEQVVGGVKVFVSGRTLVTVLPHTPREDTGNRIRGLEKLTQPVAIWYKHTAVNDLVATDHKPEIPGLSNPPKSEERRIA